MKMIKCIACGASELKRSGNTCECAFCGSKYILDKHDNLISKEITDAALITLYGKAADLHNEGEFVKELEVLMKALKMEETNFRTLLKIGRCYRHLDQPDTAIEYYKRSIELNPNEGRAYANIGTIYILRQDYEEALKYYEKGLPMVDKATSDYWGIYANYAIVVARLGDPQKAEQMIREAEAHGYDRGESMRNMAGIESNPLISEGITDAAIAKLYVKAQNLREKSKFAEELEVLMKALEMDETSARTVLKIGRCYKSLGQLDKAIEYYKRGIELDPNDGRGYANMGNICISRQDYEGALKYYEKGMPLIDKAIFDYWVGYANYAIVVAKLGDPQKAEQMIREAEAHGYENGKIIRGMAGIKRKSLVSRIKGLFS